MPVSEEFRNEQRAAEIFDLAVQGLVLNLGVNAHEAATMYLCASRPAARPCRRQGSDEVSEMTDVCVAHLGRAVDRERLAVLVGI